MAGGAILEEAHRTAAKATGRISGMLALQKIGRADLEICVKQLRLAADQVESLLPAVSKKPLTTPPDAG